MNVIHRTPFVFILILININYLNNNVNVASCDLCIVLRETNGLLTADHRNRCWNQ